MKLNHDIVREVLLVVEEHLDSNSRFDAHRLAEQIESNTPEFKNDEIMYAIAKLTEVGYLNAQPITVFCNGKITPSFIIRSITWSGHEFLDSIRDTKIWAETKSTASKVGEFSLSILGQIATKIAMNKLGL